MHWYKRDPNAALTGMSMLTLEEVGVYNYIIDSFYANEGKLRDDDYIHSRALRINPRTWRKHKIALFQRQKVTVRDGFLIPNRGESTLNEARTFSELQSKRVGKRWERHKKINRNNGGGIPTGITNTPTPTPTPIKKESKKEATNGNGKGRGKPRHQQVTKDHKRIWLDVGTDDFDAYALNYFEKHHAPIVLCWGQTGAWFNLMGEVIHADT